MRWKFWRHADADAAAAPTPEPEPPLIGSPALAQLSTVFAAPRWLRDLGRTSWLLVGVFLLMAGVTWLVGTTYTIVGPVVAAAIVATVAMPLVSLLERHRVPRLAGAVIVLLLLVAIAVAIVIIVISGITAQHGEIAKQTSSAVDKAGNWLKDLGVDKPGVSKAKDHVSTQAPEALATLTKGVIHGIRGLVSLVFALSFSLIALLLLLKDGPSMRRWVDAHLGVPPSVAQTMTGGVIRSLRGYFRGVTLVAAFNAAVVALGAWLLDVPLVGTIAVVTFITAYVPYLGAFVAGAFVFLIALGAKGTTTAVIMLVIFLLANGLLQNIFQPFAMGSALDLHPLVVLVVTIAAGCIFGMLGLVLAAPLTSAAVHITRDLARAREAAAIAEPEPAAATPG